MLFSFETLPLVLRSLQGDETPTGLGPWKKDNLASQALKSSEVNYQNPEEKQQKICFWASHSVQKRKENYFSAVVLQSLNTLHIATYHEKNNCCELSQLILLYAKTLKQKGAACFTMNMKQHTSKHAERNNCVAKAYTGRLTAKHNNQPGQIHFSK